MYIQTDRQAGRQTDRQTGRQADRQTGRQTDKHIDRHIRRVFTPLAYVMSSINSE